MDSTESNLAESDKVLRIETNLDDVSPEVIGFVSDRLFAAGALDVWHTPVQMKKHRPGTVLTVLCAPETETTIAEIILSETTAFGLRIETVHRKILGRRIIDVNTTYGTIAVKLGFLGNQLVQASPEYESCRAAALRLNTPLRLVQDAARTAALEAAKSPHPIRSSTTP
jgi:pyridinium-3,5-bisthiocarboxylic acid mononucleotide nickel chelatase